MTDAVQIEKYEDTKQEITVGSIEEQEVHRSTSVSTTSEQVLSFPIYIYIYSHITVLGLNLLLRKERLC